MVHIAILALPETAAPGHLSGRLVYQQILLVSVCTMKKSYLLISHQRCLSGTSQVLCAKHCVQG